MTRRRPEPWEVSFGVRIPRWIGWTASIVGFLTVAVLFVDVLQPAAFRLVGDAVTALGGSPRAAVVVIVGVWLLVRRFGWGPRVAPGRSR